MTKKTNKPAKTVKNETTTAPVVAATSTMSQTNQDLMFSILVVSVVINLFVLTGWIALQVTNVYNAEVATFLFTR